MNPVAEATFLALEARVEPAEVRPGERATLVVEARIPEGGHIEAHEPPDPYLIPTVLALTAGDGVAVGPVAYPDPEERRFAWSPIALLVLSGTVRFEAPVVVAESAAAGARTISGRLRYQACTQGACLPPEEQAVEATVMVLP